MSSNHIPSHYIFVTLINIPHKHIDLDYTRICRNQINDLRTKSWYYLHAKKENNSHDTKKVYSVRCKSFLLLEKMRKRTNINPIMHEQD